MKKIKLLLISAITIITVVIAAGCGSATEAGTKNTEAATPEVTTSEATTPEASTPEATTSAGNTDSTSELQKNIDRLIKDNYECGIKIIYGTLPHANDTKFDPNDESTYLSKVTDERFKSYAEFESYVRSIYAKDTADKLLNDYPYEGKPLYVNKDGELYIHLSLTGAKGYYVDWSNAKVEIKNIQENTCEFTVTASLEEPADNPTPVDYTVDGKAVKEDGKWLLTSILY